VPHACAQLQLLLPLLLLLRQHLQEHHCQLHCLRRQQLHRLGCQLLLLALFGCVG
jgi:hypothetical protein